MPPDGLRYEQVEHTADIALRIFGNDLPELFDHAGQAMFEQLGDFEMRDTPVRREIELESSDLEALFHDWLSELNFLHQQEHEIYFRFDVQIEAETKLKAKAHGRKIDEDSDSVELEIKAVTWHRLKVEKPEGGGWEAFVIFDI